MRTLGNNSISKHAFAKQPCSASCPIRKNRLKEIARLEADIALLTKFDLPAPKATSRLETLQHFQHICNDGDCHRE